MDQKIANLVKFEFTHKDDNKIEAKLTISEEIPTFQGHFPNRPILPAVSIIDISLLLLSQVCPNISNTQVEVKRSKFMALVRPNQEVDLVAESTDSKNWKVYWKLAENQSKLAQIHLVV